jgi:hypothetical protein
MPIKKPVVRKKKPRKGIAAGEPLLHDTYTQDMTTGDKWYILEEREELRKLMGASLKRPEGKAGDFIEGPGLDTEAEIEYNVGDKARTSVKKATAQAVGALIKAGVAPTVAAKQLRTSLATLFTDADARRIVKTVIENYTMDADTRRTLQRALTNQIALEAAYAGDKQIALAALKQMADDPELGLKSEVPSTMTQTNISIGLAKLAEEELGPAKGEILEAEIEEVPKNGG